jgi:hypothetical protein
MQSVRVRKLRQAVAWLQSEPQGRRIYRELLDMRVRASKALDGPSNDEEHNALYLINDTLVEMVGRKRSRA